MRFMYPSCLTLALAAYGAKGWTQDRGVISGTALQLALQEACTSAPDPNHSTSYSVLAPANTECISPSQEPQPSPQAKAQREEFFDPQWLKMQMLGISVIYFAQRKGGTDLLSNLWYAGAVLSPPLMAHDPAYGMGKNYLAVTPALLALGFLNEYLSRDDAAEPRVFLSNIIGYNLALHWSHKVLTQPELFFGGGGNAHHPPPPGLTLGLSATSKAIGAQLAWRW